MWLGTAICMNKTFGLNFVFPQVVKSSLLPYICILGDRMKYVNEGTALNSIDKIAAEHIRRQLTVRIFFLPILIADVSFSAVFSENFFQIQVLFFFSFFFFVSTAMF